jgi:hypothetical protein
MYLQVIQILRLNFENVYTQELAVVPKACVLEPRIALRTDNDYGAMQIWEA